MMETEKLENPNTSNNPAPVPVALGARSSKNTIELYTEIQKFGLVLPAFHFDIDNSGGWSVKMEFLGEVLEEKGPFGSKQEGKEMLAGQALEMVRKGVKEGIIVKPVKAKKLKNALGAGEANGVPEVVEKKEPGPNYIGQLSEFQRANSALQPIYLEYQHGTQFSCVVTIDNLPNRAFSSKTDLFSNKKAARQNAAKCAIEYFKSQGLWPDDVTSVGGIKKKKVVQIPPQPLPVTSPSPKKLLNSSSPTSPGPSPGPGTSYASQVAQIAISLGLPTPEWRFHEDPNASAPPTGFHTLACFFKNGGPHAGPIGETRHIFGRKKAKEECARKTLEYLNQVKERRLSSGRRMLEGVENRDQAADGATKRQFEEEIGLGVGMQMDEDIDMGENDEFEDAEERFLVDV
ncbi:uncharacterized protein BDR25DRAFT_322433 [Lindgomyces ingoldianus]|uniref:Uncharacterized protein n=1 Tax=Lindgomyces ingoldianus TaxID=673940 RepID=A0ACB6RAR3_9PLEO|nr:uncharacterized protein BDR25DRAFT_322433 [Lindgomyces ingoldianus]KAF2476145.1 hypothetical protein BDR25DRAFT_322433 [Lindgomyces ingoldianus]